MNKTSKPYLSGEFDEFFDAASTGNLTNEEAAVYAHAYFEEVDKESALRFAEKQAELKNLREIVGALRKKGFNNFEIASLIDKPTDCLL